MNENKGMLLLGKETIIDDIVCSNKFATVRVRGKTNLIRVPYDAISWVSGDWLLQRGKKSKRVHNGIITTV